MWNLYKAFSIFNGYLYLTSKMWNLYKAFSILNGYHYYKENLAIYTMYVNFQTTSNLK